MNDDWRRRAEQEMNRALKFNAFLDSLSRSVRDTKGDFRKGE